MNEFFLILQHARGSHNKITNGVQKESQKDLEVCRIFLGVK